eukprot:CAMPEP_0197046750 /NCGR_PEP_ID=MMETSP1384-20130603/22399_1 /TAXON_ID=29189 /ORGANISM="Ammonia sp." /LENGTH=192 /DNA_ID=CAMNT_0042478585 /DNA_START=251 /DNA_END=829 /DNA_ORIENTATION=+
MVCPSNAAIIQCTNCAMIQDPYYEYDIQCSGCKHTLTHPITARIIQCPVCVTIIDVSVCDSTQCVMELVQQQHERNTSKSKKRKRRSVEAICNEDEDGSVQDTSDSNTTVSSVDEEDARSTTKRRKIDRECKTKDIFEYKVQPNRPLPDGQKTHQLFKQTESDFTKPHKKRKANTNANAKYGSFSMTPIAFI